MFALLPADGYVTLQAAFGDDSDATLNAAHKDKRIADLRPIAGRIPEQSGYPMLVTFGDLTDPTSVALVAPDNLAASFGESVTLRRITVQMTDEDVTSGIGARLQAIGINIHHGLDDVKGVTATPTLAQQLGYGNFSTESIK